MSENRICNSDDRIKDALDVLVRYGGTDGAHHKDWVIDQAVRCLTGCPRGEKTAIDCRGVEYKYEALGESEEYKEVVRQAKAGEDGPDTYSWEIGIAP